MKNLQVELKAEIIRIKIKLNRLQNLETNIVEYKKLNPSESFWVWCINRGIEVTEDEYNLLMNYEIR